MARTLDELKDAVQRPLGGPPFVRSTIVVHDIHDDGSHLTVDVEAGAAGGRTQRWLLTMPSVQGDLTSMSLESASFTLRANLEEWWDTRGQYPDGMPGLAERRLG
jgi:hypothetical protein